MLADCRLAAARGCPCHVAGRSLRPSRPLLTRCLLRSALVASLANNAGSMARSTPRVPRLMTGRLDGGRWETRGTLAAPLSSQGFAGHGWPRVPRLMTGRLDGGRWETRGTLAAPLSSQGFAGHGWPRSRKIRSASRSKARAPRPACGASAAPARRSCGDLRIG